MKSRLHAVLLAIATVALAACASGGGIASSQGGQQPYQAPDRQVTDAEYMALVERKALSRGVDVHWVQPPLKRVVASDD